MVRQKWSTVASRRILDVSRVEDPHLGVSGFPGQNIGTIPLTTLHFSPLLSWMCMGRQPPKLLRYGDTPTPNANVEELLKDRDNILVELRENLEVAQGRMQKAANKHRRDGEYTVGDWVYLKLRPYRQSSVAYIKNDKLFQRYFGPYQIMVGLLINCSYLFTATYIPCFTFHSSS